MARVLVVEDDIPIGALVADQLSRAGHEVQRAVDGEEALRVFRERPADLVVLDVMLPKRNGIEVCSAIRQGGGPQPVVLMLTARVGEEDAVAGFEAGADDYVRKPFGVAELSRRVGALLALRERSRPAPDARSSERVVIGGELVIELDARSVRVRATELRLTPKELDLLAHLAQRPGRVLEREELLAEVWGYSHAGYARTVDSHVTRVRKKLAAAGLTFEPITTVHGVGYRFDPPGEPRSA